MPMIRLTLKPFAGALTGLRGRRGVMHVIGVVAVRLITKGTATARLHLHNRQQNSES